MAPAFVSAGKPQEGKYEEERKEEDSGWKEKGFYTLCGRAGEREGFGKQAAKVVSGRILKKKKKEGVGWGRGGIGLYGNRDGWLINALSLHTAMYLSQPGSQACIYSTGSAVILGGIDMCSLVE